MMFDLPLSLLLLIAALPVLPVVLPLLCGSLLLLIPGRRLRMGVAVVGSSLTLLSSLLIAWVTLSGDILVRQVASWPAPFGISLVADGLTGLMMLLSSVVVLLGVVYMGSSFHHAPQAPHTSALNRAREAFGAQALLQFLLMGVNMSFLTGDLFNLFVAFEVMLIASYGLLLLGGEFAQLREGFRYVVMNLVASTIFVVTAGFAYGLFGTLNMADIADRVAEAGPDPRVALIAALLAVVFGFKAALFPLGFWLPSAYPAPPIVFGAVFSALLTKVGVYALLRMLTLLFPDVFGLPRVLLLFASATMLVGVLGMIARHEWRHWLAFANVASIGYLVLGISLGTFAGLQATIFYLLHTSLLILTLFLLAGLAETIAGVSFRSAGHLALYPWLGVGMLVSGLALAGLPPTSGFVAKFGLLKALFEVFTPFNIIAAVAAVLTSLLLLYTVVEMWRSFFWGASDSAKRVALPPLMRLSSAIGVSLLVLLVVFAGPIYQLSGSVAAQLGDPDVYISAVLPDDPPPLQRPPDDFFDRPSPDETPPRPPSSQDPAAQDPAAEGATPDGAATDEPPPNENDAVETEDESADDTSDTETPPSPDNPAEDGVTEDDPTGDASTEDDSAEDDPVEDNTAEDDTAEDDPADEAGDDANGDADDGGETSGTSDVEEPQ